MRLTQTREALWEAGRVQIGKEARLEAPMLITNEKLAPCQWPTGNLPRQYVCWLRDLRGGPLDEGGEATHSEVELSVSTCSARPA